MNLDILAGNIASDSKLALKELPIFTQLSPQNKIDKNDLSEEKKPTVIKLLSLKNSKNSELSKIKTVSEIARF